MLRGQVAPANLLLRLAKQATVYVYVTARTLSSVLSIASHSARTHPRVDEEAILQLAHCTVDNPQAGRLSIMSAAWIDIYYDMYTSIREQAQANYNGDWGILCNSCPTQEGWRDIPELIFQHQKAP